VKIGFVVRGLGFVVGAAVIPPALAGAPPGPTPTPRPRLSGGFGRPRATPPPATAGAGQSLADVVRSAQDARGQNPERGTVTIDNKSLVTNPDKGRVSTSKIQPARLAPPAPSPVRAAAGTAPPAPFETGAAVSPPGGTEAEWRQTAQAARQRVATAKARVAELEATVKKLETDFYAWDDGQYRDRVIKPSWDRSLRELEESKRELAAAEKDLVDLPENARRAGAQPGWIRE
jgi:hypothetical protein